MVFNHSQLIQLHSVRFDAFLSMLQWDWGGEVFFPSDLVEIFQGSGRVGYEISAAWGPQRNCHKLTNVQLDSLLDLWRIELHKLYCIISITIVLVQYSTLCIVNGFINQLITSLQLGVSPCTGWYCQRRSLLGFSDFPTLPMWVWLGQSLDIGLPKRREP